MTGQGCILDNILVPGALLRGYPSAPAPARAAQGLVATSLGWVNGRFCSLAAGAGLPRVNAEGWTILPKLADCHVHLDKTYTLERTGFADGTLGGAAALMSDHAPGWSKSNHIARMSRAAETAAAHGTGLLRTHVDTPGRAGDFPAWAAAQEVRRSFAGRVQIQMTSLSAISRATLPGFDDHCRDVKQADGVLGAFVPPGPVDPATLTAFLSHAHRHGLDVDFHIDEALDVGTPNVATLAQVIMQTGFAGRVLAGHCCALSMVTPDMLDRTLDAIAASGMTIAALPSTNLYLQDRTPGRTPRHRGITRLHELRARGIPVALATDNVEDAFFPFGSYDLLDGYRSAATTLHLDGDLAGWLTAITDVPARAMGIADFGLIAPDTPAEAFLVRATSWPRILSTPAERRIALGPDVRGALSPDQLIGEPT